MNQNLHDYSKLLTHSENISFKLVSETLKQRNLTHLAKDEQEGFKASKPLYFNIK